MDKVDAADVFTPAALIALEAFPVEPADVKLVSLTENATFRVVDRQGVTRVLRLHRPWYHTHEELLAERIWIRALGKAGVGVPAALLTRDGEEYTSVMVPATGEWRFAGMASWTDGRILDEILDETSDASALAVHFGRLGAVCAAMHNQSAGWRPPAGFFRHALDADGLVGEEPRWGRFWEHRGLSDAERALLIEMRDRVRIILADLPQRPDTYGLIHADLHAGNIVVDGDRLTVIDFDDAAFGWHHYDIAVALSSHASPAVERAFVDGYRAARPFSDADVALIPLFRLVRALVQIGWFHQRPEVETPERLAWMKAYVLDLCETVGRKL